MTATVTLRAPTEADWAQLRSQWANLQAPSSRLPNPNSLGQHATALAIVAGPAVGLMTVTPWTRGACASLAYWIAAEYRGNGFATAAVQRCLNAARTTGLGALVSAVANDNPASFRILSKCGFQIVVRRPDDKKAETVLVCGISAK